MGIFDPVQGFPEASREVGLVHQIGKLQVQGKQPFQRIEMVRFFVEHGFDDPSFVEGPEEEKVEAFRATRDDIKKWILDYF